MQETPLHLARIVHESLSTVLAFAYSQGPLERMMTDDFLGEWKHLSKVVYDLSKARADRACIELATFLRILDDIHQITEYHQKTKVPDCGRVFHKDGRIEVLTFREFANKVIHAKGLHWDFPDGQQPRLTIDSAQPERWQRAEVNLLGVAAVCGTVAS